MKENNFRVHFYLIVNEVPVIAFFPGGSVLRFVAEPKKEMGGHMQACLHWVCKIHLCYQLCGHDSSVGGHSNPESKEGWRTVSCSLALGCFHFHGYYSWCTGWTGLEGGRINHPELHSPSNKGENQLTNIDF